MLTTLIILSLLGPLIWIRKIPDPEIVKRGKTTENL